MKEKINIISFNMSRYSDWHDTGVVNRNYHIVHNLAKDERVNKIICVDFFPFNYKRALKYFILNNFTANESHIIHKSLFSKIYKVNYKISVYSTIYSIFNKSKIIIELNKYIKELEMQNNLVVINFNPLYVDYFKKLNQKINIFDAVDNWSTHSSYIKEKKLIEYNYKVITKNSDLIYAVSENLVEYLNSPKAIFLPNAVDYNHFQTIEKIKILENIDSPIVGFLGILQDRIDVELIDYIAKNNTEKVVVLAGPVWKNFPKEKLLSNKNIIFTGSVSYNDIPKYYNTFSVGIIPYKTNKFIKSTNSMKYYEYLASGLPVISTRSGGADKFKEIISIADNNKEFNNMINLNIKTNNAIKIKNRKSFVKYMTWEERINELLSVILSKI